MSDLVLRTRLAVLKGSLEQVKSLRGAVTGRGAELERLRELLVHADVSAKQMVRAAQLHLIRAEGRLKELELEIGDSEAVTAAVEEVERVKGAVEDLSSGLGRAEELIQRMCDRLVIVAEDRLGNTLERELEKKAETWLSELKRLQLGGQEGDLQKAWEIYADKANESEPLLAEYVDFLRGLALRQMGFDEGVCRIADHLLGICEKAGITWQSLTIPDQEEAAAMTLARIVRLGFPEWTIWVLPLAAHEMGLVAISDNHKLSEFVKQEAADAATRELLQDCLSDAYATYSMGPAYACAAILMRFDPLSSVDVGAPRDAQRAYVVFKMLEAENATHAQRPYDEIIAKLREAWDSALVQTRRVGELEDATIERLDRWVDYLRSEFLQSDAITTLYLPDSWIATAEWQSLLLGEDDDLAQFAGDLRDVLNAAWRCRVYHPDEAGPIARRAQALCEHVLLRKSEGGAIRAGARAHGAAAAHRAQTITQAKIPHGQQGKP